MNVRRAVMMALGALAFSAQASIIDWGEHDPVETAKKATPAGDFAGRYLFSLDDPSTSLIAKLVNKQPGQHGIENGVVKLFEEAGEVDVMVGKFAFNAAYGATKHKFGALEAGNYYYRVSGNGVGENGGLYSLTSTVAAPTAVPEPEPYTLMLFGFGVIGLLAWRRRAGPESS
jgi:hypothetical protein